MRKNKNKIKIMNLLEEYKDLYYKEIEFNDRLNNRISNCITFLTIIGSALILLWSQIKNYEILWYTGVYLVFCIITTLMFFICILKFFRTYSGYKTHYFPVEEVALQNMRVLNSTPDNQKDNANEILELKMAERFINDAIHNRKLNIEKNNRHRNLICMLMATFIMVFISFTINISIEYYETNYKVNEVQQIYINGGEIHVR